MINIDEVGDLPRFSTTERLIVELLTVHHEMFGVQESGLSQYLGRARYWLPLAVFSTAALAISVAARRTTRRV